MFINSSYKIRPSYVLYIANATIIDLEPADVVELNQIAKTEPFRACHPSWAGWGNLGFTESV